MCKQLLPGTDCYLLLGDRLLDCRSGEVVRRLAPNIEEVGSGPGGPNDRKAGLPARAS